MVILPRIIKFVKKNWKKILIITVSLIAFWNIFVIGINLYIKGYIPVKEIGEIEAYERYSISGHYVDTKEQFLERLETFEERGWSLEDINEVRKKLLQYEDNVLIIFSNYPIQYLFFHRDAPQRVHGSYVYREGEQRTKIYVYITDYQDRIYQSQFWESWGI